MKYPGPTTCPSEQAVTASVLLCEDRRKLQNIISCSGDSHSCPVQGNPKCHTIYLSCINCCVEDGALNTLFEGFRLTGSKLPSISATADIAQYLSLSSSAADLSTLTLSWLEPLMEKSDEIVLNKDPTFSTGTECIQCLHSMSLLLTFSN